jgi:hypothetical protein
MLSLRDPQRNLQNHRHSRGLGGFSGFGRPPLRSMIPDDDQLRALVARPGESLNVEIKRWLDPADPAGIAKIVKAAFALRNRNGGFLVIGFNDKTLEPDLSNAPPDARGAFHQDTIQGLISRHVYEPFEVHATFAASQCAGGAWEALSHLHRSVIRAAINSRIG